MASLLPGWPIGASITVDSHTGPNKYKCTRQTEQAYSCECMAWEIQSGKSIRALKTCKHLRELLGDELSDVLLLYETTRTGAAPKGKPAKKKKKAIRAAARGDDGAYGAGAGGKGAAASDGGNDDNIPSPSNKVQAVPKRVTKKKAKQIDAEQLKALQPNQNLQNSAIQLLMANKFDPEKLDPKGYWISEKLDGVRAFWDGQGTLWTRMARPFSAPKAFLDRKKSHDTVCYQDQHANDKIHIELPRGHSLDGELFIDRGRFDETSGIVRTTVVGVDSDARWQQIKYMVFDIPSYGHLPFETRQAKLNDLFTGNPQGLVSVVEQVECKGMDHLIELVNAVADKGGEGVMLRQPKSIYVNKRDKSLLKVKSFYDAEARVVGYEPGRGKYEGMVGSLICEMESGMRFNVGSGLTDERRSNPPEIDSIITYKFQELTKLGVPRFPTFVGQRFDLDEPKDANVPSTAQEARQMVSGRHLAQ
ncbi:hypothetical protein OIO90_003217 [Microbotryomycetes sp. JL221]|nr:hypothetical protein OIO90_003217 [Microbotryomycetes sp. JL221]